MIGYNPLRQPGVGSAKTARYKVIFKGGILPDVLPGGRSIDATKSRDPSNSDDVAVLLSGLLLGKITSSGLYAPSILGVTTGAIAAGATSISVAAAVITELVRRIGSSGTFKLTGPPVASGAVVTETITYSAASGTTITCTATTNAFIAGAFVQPTDGSESPLTFVPDGYGIPVLDFDGSSLDSVQLGEVPIGGMIYSDRLVNWPSDTSLRQWIVNRLNDVAGGQFVFDHIY